MRVREYCCCAVPLVNVGIYATLTEQLVLAFVVGTLSVATPSIVGAATPSFAPALFAVFCYVAAAIQTLGFLGVAQEKPTMYRRYVTLHTGASVAVFAIAAVWIIISAARHSTAQSKCVATFFSASASTSSEGQTLCDIFSWVDVGVMAGAWVFFALVQTYLLFIVSSYSASLREGYEKYGMLNDSTRQMTNDIPMADRGDPWDSRASYELGEGRGRGHHTKESSVSTVVGAPSHKDGHDGYDTYPSRGPEFQHTGDRIPSRRRPGGY